MANEGRNRQPLADNRAMPVFVRAYATGALTTVATLLGGLVLGVGLGTLIFHVLPGSDVLSPQPVHVTLSAIPALAGFLAGGAAWGAAMGRLAAVPDIRRAARAGLLSFAPICLIFATGLALLEEPLVSAIGRSAGIHRIFTVLFVPSAFVIAGVSAWGWARGTGNGPLATALFWRAGLGAGLGFLAANLVMEVAGWVVGGPGAAERATMVTVLAVSATAAALAAGGIVGHTVMQRR